MTISTTPEQTMKNALVSANPLEDPRDSAITNTGDYTGDSAGDNTGDNTKERSRIKQETIGLILRTLLGIMAFFIIVMGTALYSDAYAGEAGVLPPEFRFSFKIARNDLNRILFPFSGITVSTVAEGEIKTEGGALYVLPESEEPLTLFVSPEDNPGISFLLELTPVSGRARSYTIPLPEPLKTPAGDPESARDSRTPVSRETALSRGFSGIWRALDRAAEIPEEIPGYTFVPESTVKKLLGKTDTLCSGYQETEFSGAWRSGPYLYVMLVLKNKLAIKTAARCEGKRILGFSILNTTEILPQGRRRILAAFQGNF